MLLRTSSTLILVAAMLLQGCASMSTVTNHRAGSSDPLVFGGTRVWIGEFSGENANAGLGKAQWLMLHFPPLLLVPFFDTLFSFVADTVLLPITIPWALSEELSNATVADRFNERIKDIYERCAKRKLFPGEGCGPVASLKPFDVLATEEGRFAASLMIPNPIPTESGYKSGMSSTEYFEHLCKTEAGEFIYKSVDKVAGIFQMRPRPRSSYARGHLYASEDPYGEWGSDGLSPEYLGGPSGYSFVEAVAGSERAQGSIGGQVRNESENGKYIRYLVEFRGSRWQTKPTKFDTRLKSRYGYTWRGITRPHDRELGIAGSEVIVLDLTTQEILGVLRGYARFDFTKGVRKWASDELGMAWGDRCPNPSSKLSIIPQREFMFKVLRP